MITSSTSCASLSKPSAPPSPELQTRRIDLESPALVYDYYECVKEFLGLCLKKEPRRKKDDLTKPEVRKELNDMGLVCKVRWKP